MLTHTEFEKKFRSVSFVFFKADSKGKMKRYNNDNEIYLYSAFFITGMLKAQHKKIQNTRKMKKWKLKDRKTLS